MQIAFWNIGGNGAALVALAADRALDLLVVAECADPDAAAAALQTVDSEWRRVLGTGPRTALFRRGPRVVPRLAAGWGALVEVKPPTAEPILVTAVHLRSRMNATASDIGFDCYELRREIVRAEAVAGHRRTLLVGDFNLDPFDIGLCDRRTLMGVMDRRLVERLDRRETTRGGVFYNPMWSRLGDDSPGPPGTYYRSKDDHHDYVFHTFDQALLRPALVPALTALDVPRALGGEPLVSPRDLPRRKAFSDHLPLIIDLDLRSAT